METTPNDDDAAGHPTLEIHIAQSGEERWVAATRTAPFLYLTADSYDQLILKLKTCCRFYLSNQHAIASLAKARETRKTEPKLTDVRSISLRDLMKVG